MIHRGEMPAEPFVLVCQRYLADRSRSNGDTTPIYARAHVPAGGDPSRRYAPRFRVRIPARHAPR